MSRSHKRIRSDGMVISIQFTPEEEAARDLEEQQWANDRAVRILTLQRVTLRESRIKELAGQPSVTLEDKNEFIKLLLERERDK